MMNSAPPSCARRQASPISNRLRCHVVPRGASAPRRIFTGSPVSAGAASAQAPKRSAVVAARTGMHFMDGLVSVGEEPVDARKQPPGATLRDQVGETPFADAIRLNG